MEILAGAWYVTEVDVGLTSDPAPDSDQVTPAFEEAPVTVAVMLTVCPMTMLCGFDGLKATETPLGFRIDTDPRLMQPPRKHATRTPARKAKVRRLAAMKSPTQASSEWEQD